MSRRSASFLRESTWPFSRQQPQEGNPIPQHQEFAASPRRGRSTVQEAPSLEGIHDLKNSREAMYMIIIGAVLAVVLVRPVYDQVHVDSGSHFPSRPPLVVGPGIQRAQPVPSEPDNLRLYDAQYWAFANGGWYVSSGYNGPWIVIAPQFVPRPVLLVPVRYYHVPPGHWHQW